MNLPPASGNEVGPPCELRLERIALIKWRVSVYNVKADVTTAMTFWTLAGAFEVYCEMVWKFRFKSFGEADHHDLWVNPVIHGVDAAGVAAGKSRE